MNTGVEADLLLFTTILNEPTSGYVAWATNCFQDAASGRPIVGQINFNLAYLNVDNLNYESTVKVLIHEVMHILALSSGLYTSFIDANGLRYPAASLMADYKNAAGVVGK